MVIVGGSEAGCSIQRDGDDDGTDFYKGLTFKNKRTLINALQLAAVKKHYCFKKVKNTKKFFCVRCVNQSCKWWIRAMKYVDSDRFIITVYRNKHLCGLEHLSSNHPHASAELIGSYLKSSYEEGKGKGISIKDVKAAVRRDLGCNISYWKCRMGTVIAKALTRGTPEHSYAILDAYRYMLRTTNEGTHTTLKVDDNQRFMYFFVALGAWITGFAHMRKVIVVDGTHLSGKYGGVLLSAMAQDSETHIFPVAFCVVNVECDASYDYFFENLVGILPSSDELCVVSDRHPSIPKAVSKYFPQANYGVCKWRLAESIRAKLHCGEFVSYFYKSAESYTPTEFEKHFQQIRSLCPRVATYLEQVGFERWSRAFFPGRRFGVMTSNIAESINAMLKDEREYHIVAMFNGILRNFSEKFHHRRTMFLQHSKPCVPSIEQILRKNVTEGNKLYVCCVGNDVYNVGTGDEVVSLDLIQRTCSFRRFDLDELPCAHAMAALRCRYGGAFEFGNEIYQYTSGYYSTNAYILAYDGLIYPMIAEELWNAPPELYERKIKPHFVKITRGRRKTKRMPSVGEAFTSRKNRCGICKRLGHKKTTCPQRRVVDSGGPSIIS